MRKVLISCLLTLSALSSAQAADVSNRASRVTSNDGYFSLPFPRSERAQAVWDGGACWSACGTESAWGIPRCLKVDSQGRCLSFADASDRSCQRQCRSAGGPLLPIFDW